MKKTLRQVLSTPSHLSPWLAPLLLVGLSAAQGPDRSINHPVLGNCGDVAAGRVFGEAGMDALMVAGSTLVIFKCPDAYRAPVLLTNGAVEFAVERKAIGVGDPIFINSASSGLRCFAWSGTGIDEVVPQAQDAEWFGAGGIGFTEDANGNSIGFAYSGTKLGICSNTSQMWTATSWYDLNETIREVRAIDWDSAAGSEIAVRTDSSVRVHALDGSLINSYNATGPSEVLGVAGMIGTNREALLYCTGGIAGGNLHLKMRDSVQMQHSENLGVTTVVGLDCEQIDFQGDKIWDDNQLALSITTGAGLVLYDMALISSQMSLLPTSQIVLPDWNDVANNVAEPCYADFDQDGDLDLLFAPALTEKALFFYSSRVDQTERKVSVKLNSLRVVGGTGVFFVKLSNATDEAGFTDYEVTVFRQPRADCFMEAGAFRQVQYFGVNASMPWIDIQTGRSAFFEELFHMEVHLVTRDASGNVTRQGPATSLAIGLRGPIDRVKDIGVSELEEINYIPVPEVFHHDDNYVIGTPPGTINTYASSALLDYPILVENEQGIVLGGGDGEQGNNPDSDTGDPPAKD